MAVTPGPGTIDPSQLPDPQVQGNGNTKPKPLPTPQQPPIAPPAPRSWYGSMPQGQYAPGGSAGGGQLPNGWNPNRISMPGMGPVPGKPLPPPMVQGKQPDYTQMTQTGNGMGLQGGAQGGFGGGLKDNGDPGFSALGRGNDVNQPGGQKGDGMNMAQRQAIQGQGITPGNTQGQFGPGGPGFNNGQGGQASPSPAGPAPAPGQPGGGWHPHPDHPSNFTPERQQEMMQRVLSGHITPEHFNYYMQRASRHNPNLAGAYGMQQGLLRDMQNGGGVQSGAPNEINQAPPQGPQSGSPYYGGFGPQGHAPVGYM